MAQKTVLVTGASRGIGKATAEQFAQHGWRVYAAVRDIRSVTFSHPEISVIQLDVDSPGSIHRAFHLMKTKLDAVVNNAAFGLYGPLEALTDQEVEAHFTTNVLGVLRVTRAALPHMQRGGVIVNMCSIYGRMGVPFYSVYSSTKFAVRGLSESLYHELKAKGLRVKVIEASTVKTDFFTADKERLITGYESMSKRVEKWYDEHVSEADDPSVVAKLIVQAAMDGKDDLYYRPKKARWPLLAKKLLPTNYLVRKFRDKFYV